MTLSEKQLRFVEYYLAGNTATQAAIKAGYSRNSASDIGSENLKKPDIARAIEAGRMERREKAKLSAEDMVEEMHALAYYNVQDFLDAGNKIKDLTTMPITDTRAVVAVKTKVTQRTIGEVVITETTTEVKFADKLAAQANLFRHMGLFEKDNSQQKPQLDLKTMELSNVSNEALYAFLQTSKTPGNG